ncbi:hypothetical protein CP972_18690 [Streptomyces prasinus]|uniref:Uncharacterized protein n=1 Tax=Streptomyces prasinus TaxID=67345 RepID=A0ABX6AZU4_9ACTN|nr:hypothetical protein CP972_18690 [Streptomyces prasinus]
MPDGRNSGQPDGREVGTTCSDGAAGRRSTVADEARADGATERVAGRRIAARPVAARLTAA